MEYNKQLLHNFMTEKVAVHVKTQDEYDKFMKLLEKETNLSWGFGHNSPVNNNYWGVYKKRSGIYSSCGKELSYWNVHSYKNADYKIIEFLDLIEENIMKFKVGDKVRIRSWESMEKEFGLNRWGEINCPTPFTKGMKEYCGTVQTVGGISYGTYYMENISYYFDGRALEPVKQETNGEYNRKEIKKIRNEYPDYDCIAVVNDKPAPCHSTRCKSCLFFKNYIYNPTINKYCGICTSTSKEGFKKWCAEPYKAPEEQLKPEKKSILDKTEHDYLAAVIAPKRIHKNVADIVKHLSDNGDSYYIMIRLSDGCSYLPKFFEKDHMYDGMEADEPYTLGELGL